MIATVSLQSGLKPMNLQHREGHGNLENAIGEVEVGSLFSHVVSGCLLALRITDRYKATEQRSTFAQPRRSLWRGVLTGTGTDPDVTFTPGERVLL